MSLKEEREASLDSLVLSSLDADDVKDKDSDSLISSESDLEANKPSSIAPTSRPHLELEYTTPTHVKLLLLAGYFALNLILTIYNKKLLNSFPFPWLLTVIHTSCTSLGCLAFLYRGDLELAKLNTRENLILVAFSLLFTLNIAMSNVSLAAVSVPFHQIMRSTTPVWVIAIYRVVYGRTYEKATYLSLIPVMIGVAMATYGDYLFTMVGFLLTFAGVLLAATKTVATNRLLTGSLSLPSMELLLRMSPLAAVQALIFSAMTGELHRFHAHIVEDGLTMQQISVLAVNGVLAFALNVSSFQTNKLAGALTLGIAGNVKQCLTIVLGVVLFNVRVSMLNGVGMGIALAGAAWYTRVEIERKTRAK